MGLGKILKSLRNSCKYSQQYVADCLNISRNAYMAWENGETQVNMRRLLQICEIYQISLQELLIHGEEVMKAPEKKQTTRKVKQNAVLLQKLTGDNQLLDF